MIFSDKQFAEQYFSNFTGDSGSDENKKEKSHGGGINRMVDDLFGKKSNEEENAFLKFIKQNWQWMLFLLILVIFYLSSIKKHEKSKL